MNHHRLKQKRIKCKNCLSESKCVCKTIYYFSYLIPLHHKAIYDMALASDNGRSYFAQIEQKCNCIVWASIPKNSLLSCYCLLEIVLNCKKGNNYVSCKNLLNRLFTTIENNSKITINRLPYALYRNGDNYNSERFASTMKSVFNLHNITELANIKPEQVKKYRQRLRNNHKRKVVLKNLSKKSPKRLTVKPQNELFKLIINAYTKKIAVNTLCRLRLCVIFKRTMKRVKYGIINRVLRQVLLIDQNASVYTTFRTQDNQVTNNSYRSKDTISIESAIGHEFLDELQTQDIEMIFHNRSLNNGNNSETQAPNEEEVGPKEPTNSFIYGYLKVVTKIPVFMYESPITILDKRIYYDQLSLKIIVNTNRDNKRLNKNNSKWKKGAKKHISHCVKEINLCIHQQRSRNLNKIEAMDANNFLIKNHQKIKENLDYFQTRELNFVIQEIDVNKLSHILTVIESNINKSLQITKSITPYENNIQIYNFTKKDLKFLNIPLLHPNYLITYIEKKSDHELSSIICTKTDSRTTEIFPPTSQMIMNDCYPILSDDESDISKDVINNHNRSELIFFEEINSLC